ncbi:MAG: hypothetical protein WC661_15835 [Opitutaceae bacterium]
MKNLILPILAVATLLGLSGCVTQPAANTPTSAAYTLGDRSTFGMDEIVVSLPFRDASSYQNLHISLGMIINPVRPSLSPEYEARDLVRRLEPRINATVSAAFQELGLQSLSSTKALRAKAITEAEAVLSQAIRNWTHAADYKIEVTVLSFYWTDPSVGRQPAAAASRW